MLEKISIFINKLIQKINWKELFRWKARGGRLEYTIIFIIVFSYIRILWPYVVRPLFFNEYAYDSTYTALDNFLYFALTVPWVLAFIFFQVRRFHDWGWRGVWALLLIFPYVRLIVIAVSLFCPGSKKTNRYGTAATRLLK